MPDSDSIQTVAVTGASGLVGSALCRQLANERFEVIRLVRPSSTETQSVPTDCLLWDPDSGIQKLDSRQVDAVVHLAGRSIGEQRWNALEKGRIAQSRIVSTQVLADQLASLPKPPQVMVSASAVGLYGDCADAVVDESSPPAETFLADVASKWEAACDPLVSSTTTRVVHPRLGIVLSKSGGALAKVLPLFRRFLGGRLGSGRQYWSWISLEDCVRAIIWMLRSSQAEGPYNVVSPNPVTNADFTRDLAKAVGRPVSLPVPEFALRLAMGEMADALLLTSCRAVPSRLLADGFTFNDPQLYEFFESELTSA
ncbi:MAG TPA: TIGR01777 family protein [Planctomycetaceae bacterium]|nr:TIGR01777 family protein [Planctomycetaceae bacterium]